MAARAISSGTISFGLVAIPVKVYTAASSKNVHFSMLHETDKGRLKQSYTCRKCDEPVERDQTVKGYEYSRDQYVVLTEEELKAIERASDRTIEIEQFVPIEQVDPVFFEKSNLLGPDKGGAKPYRLLRQSMIDSGRVAIGRFNTRGRQQLVLIRPTRDGLVLHGLYYADEVRSFDDIDLGDEVELKDSELDLARQLIGSLSESRFRPERFEDEYRRRVLEAVDQKVAGQEIVLAPKTEPKEQIIDLVAALKESLAKRGAPASATADEEEPAAKGEGKGEAKGEGKDKKKAARKSAVKKGKKKAATRKKAANG